MPTEEKFKRHPVLSALAGAIGAASALIALALAVLLVADHLRISRTDPLNDPLLIELREQWAASTDHDEFLSMQIRTLDFHARRTFFSHQTQRRIGGFLLLGSAVLCFLSLNLVRHWNPKGPGIRKIEQDDPWETDHLSRQMLAATALILLAVALVLTFSTQSHLDTLQARTMAGPEADTPDIPHPPAWDPAMNAQWPAFRGPGATGHAREARPPVHWDIASGEGVRWVAEIPVHGFNSPIVWDDRVFLSGADDLGQEVFCFDAHTGELLWTRTVETTVEFPIVSDDTGYAAPTMATDGTHVFVVFSSGELAAFDLDGNPAWQRNLGVPKNPYGKGSSLLSDGSRLFVQYDHLHEQKVMALDGATGRTLWEQPRRHISWSSPALIDTAFGPQLILNDEAGVTAYDPRSGTRLWQVDCLGGEVAPSPAFNGHDLVLVANEYARASALKLTAATPEILWQYDRFLPDIASPVATEHLLFMATTPGDVICLDAQTGTVHWMKEFDYGFNSSPILADGRIYLIDLDGVVHIFEAADTYQGIAMIETGEPVYATPAFVGNRIYIRGEDHLYCIGYDEP